MYFKMAKKDEIVRRLEGDLSNLQETVRSYAEEVRCDNFNSRCKVRTSRLPFGFGKELIVDILFPGRPVERQAHGHADYANDT